MNLDEATIGDLGLLVGHALTEQVELQLEVTRAEVAHDAREVLRNLAPLAVALPAGGVGFVFILVGCALALAPWLGAALSALVVGAAVVSAATLGGLIVLSRPESRWILPVARAGGYRVR